MTDPFLPRPSPNSHDVFECDSNSHLRGQRVMVNYEHQDGHDMEEGEYKSWLGARKKGEEPGLLISNHHISYLRAANAAPNSPSPVSCFILQINAPPTIGPSPFL